MEYRKNTAPFHAVPSARVRPPPCHPAPAGAHAWGRPARPAHPDTRLARALPAAPHASGGPALVAAGEPQPARTWHKTVPPGQPRAAAVSQVTHHGGGWLSVARLAGRAQHARPRAGRGPRQAFLTDTCGSKGGWVHRELQVPEDRPD